MHLEALNCFATAFCRTEIEGSVFGWVVCPGLGQRLDDVIDLVIVREDSASAVYRCSHASVLGEPGS